MSADEARDMFLRHMATMAHYWATTPIPPECRARVPSGAHGEALYRINGLAFSVLAAIDGAAGGCCGFRMIACGDDFAGPDITDGVSLHNLWSRYERRRA